MTLPWIWHTIWVAFEVSFWRENEHSYFIATLNPLSWSVEAHFTNLTGEKSQTGDRMRDKTDRKNMIDI